MTREELLDRYRRLRAAGREHHSAAVKFISFATMLDYGHRLGIACGDTFIYDGMTDLAFVYDLALYSARAGSSRGIDRYARSVRPLPGSDAALMLEAALQARFALWRVTERHETAGLNVWDVANEAPLWLLDEEFAATVANGTLMAGRLQPVGDFVMTSGVAVPLDEAVLESAIGYLPRTDSSSMAALVEDPRFAIAAFRAILRDGTAGRSEFRDPGELVRQTQAA